MKKDQFLLDISIKSADKVLTTNQKKQDFLNSQLSIHHKVDGVKLTLVYHGIWNEDYTKNWIVSYKGNIIYPHEFEYDSNVEIMEYSIGTSQFKFVHEHLEKIHKNFKFIKYNSPVEFFCEYLMSKPTLSSKYIIRHKIILLKLSGCSFKESFGKLSTVQTNNLFPIDLDSQRNLMGMDAPKLLFKGILSEKFPNKSYEEIKKHFLDIDSVYGGIEEGCVITMMYGLMLKWQQDYQHDKEARKAIKAQWQYEDVVLESEYWVGVRTEALRIVSETDLSHDLDSVLNQVSKSLKSVKTFHEKKRNIHVRDDIFLTAKSIIIKRMDGNNGAVIIGKFRIMSNKHYFMIHEALKNYDHFSLILVSSKETKRTLTLRRKMILECFPDINIIETTSANLIHIINKTNHNVNFVICGEDRAENYLRQLENIQDVNLHVYGRTGEDISATKIIKYIADEKYFLNNTPKEIHHMSEEIQAEYI